MCKKNGWQKILLLEVKLVKQLDKLSELCAIKFPSYSLRSFFLRKLDFCESVIVTPWRTRKHGKNEVE